jgi:aryl-alcohol dehydrogenase-like predicted oxidoreductase
MKYRRLGKTNLRVSAIGVGTWQLGGEWGKEFTQDEATSMIRRAGELGINLIDTAECYGDHTSERLMGGAIAPRERDQWIIATKFGHRFLGHLKRSDERFPAHAVKQLEDSLVALRTDHVDILQFHSVRDSEFDNEELQSTLIRLKQQGKVRHIGNSIAGSVDYRHQVDASTKAQVEVIQIIYNRLDRRPEQYAFESCMRQDLGVLARVPLASGFLSGKYKPGQTSFGPDDFRGQKSRDEIDQKLREVEQIQRTEVPSGVPMAQWALAWCLKHPAVTCVIPGCKNVEQVESNAKAAALDIVRDDHPQTWKG